MTTIIKKSELKKMIQEAIKSQMSEQNKPQDQGPLNIQLQKLYIFANKEGLYDAADFIKKVLEKKR